MKPEGRYFGWRVVWAAFTIAIFAWGIGFYGPGIFLQALHDRHGWSVSVISAAITTHFLLGALLVARFPAVEARLGITRVVLLGAVLTAMGMLGWSSATQPWHLFAAAIFSGGGWALTSGASINAMLTPWFDGRRPAAIALAFNGASMGGVIFAPLWALLITQWGFPLAGAGIALTTLVVMAALALLVLRHTPRSLGQTPDPPAPRIATAPLAPSLPPGRGIWRDAAFVRLCAGFSLGAAALVGMLAHLFSLLAPTLGAFGAGLGLSLITICAVIGRTLLGWALPAGADRRRAGAWNFAIQALGTLILLVALGVSAPLLLAGCVVVGLTVGNMLSLPPMIAQAEFTRADVGRVVALVTAVNQAVYALTPGGFGLLRDLTGSGAAVLIAAALLQVASALILFRR
ncbi:MFS transporter [Sediminicoccus sp. KRV36]|uniref:MFS transporter n=1 Tax=Sediminicoccus sp. KRV36 TaxID=3133721 RepID=UPI0020109172|nr:MFS transporter [Sediminicoccus rosea]UPY37109.1 MFS transporter [Sediminicoccus rosea]